MIWLLHCERTFFATSDGRCVATINPSPRFRPRREISSIFFMETPIWGMNLSASSTISRKGCFSLLSRS